ncbi:MAG TPA: serine/threonine protein kinase, partial [Pilimelia sp.]|nr:serine/threonine protein kinase [Pilimelia sp.]
PSAGSGAPPAADVAWTAAQAERLTATGEHRAAARLWRRTGEELARRHGEDHPRVFECRLRAARAHVPLGETDRALRLLRGLLRDRARADGPEHPAVRDLEREIARLSAEAPGATGPASAPDRPRPTPSRGR